MASVLHFFYVTFGKNYKSILVETTWLIHREEYFNEFKSNCYLAQRNSCSRSRSWLMEKVRQRAIFLHCRNCDSLTVVAVAHFDPHLAARHLAAIGRTKGG